MRNALWAGLAVFIIVTMAIGVVASQALSRYEMSLRRRMDEQERSNRELQRLNATLDEYSARVAHDVRSPLGTIQMASDVVRVEQEKLSPSGRESLDIIRRSSARAVDLVHDLLELAKAAGTPKPGPMDLDALVHDTARETRTVRLQTDGTARTIVADPTVIRQIFANLFGNASRYAADNGSAEVTVRCVEDDAEWRIAVADRGPGLDPDDAKTIFHPFTRGSQTSAQTHGTGLGLAIVSTMAEAHGGRAWYEDREGGGAEFWIALPKPPEGDPVSG
jgi:signal transduction histidine kinase